MFRRRGKDGGCVSNHVAGAGATLWRLSAWNFVRPITVLSGLTQYSGLVLKKMIG